MSVHIKVIQHLNLRASGAHGHKPREYKSPLESNDHPKLDLSPELEEDDILIYQSLIGSLQ